MSPALNTSFALQCFERGNTVELCNGIMFVFYLGLPQIYPPLPPPPPPPTHTHTQGGDESSQEYDHIKTDQEGEEEGEKDSQSTGSAEGMCTCMHNQLTTKKKVCKVTHSTGSLIPRPNFSHIACILVTK